MTDVRLYMCCRCRAVILQKDPCSCVATCHWFRPELFALDHMSSRQLLRYKTCRCPRRDAYVSGLGIHLSETEIKNIRNQTSNIRSLWSWIIYVINGFVNDLIERRISSGTQIAMLIYVTYWHGCVFYTSLYIPCTTDSISRFFLHTYLLLHA